MPFPEDRFVRKNGNFLTFPDVISPQAVLFLRKKVYRRTELWYNVSVWAEIYLSTPTENRDNAVFCRNGFYLRSDTDISFKTRIERQ